MKRVGNLYDGMISKERLEMVYSGVMKGKHHKDAPGSIAFMIRMNKDYYMAEIGRMLQEKSFRPTKPRESIRYDKSSRKFRKIQAPKLFPDQFIHWSIILAMQPTLMRGMDDWCCASVKGRGTLYAKNFLEKKLDNGNDINSKIPVSRKYKYCLKMDIRKFFENISKEILIQKLESKIKDKQLIDLTKLVLNSVPGNGIPLGYYTSQWFANFYLQSFDHDLREKIMPKYGVDTYLRYMDDMVILGSNKRKLKQLMNEISENLKSLKLELKHTSCIFSIEDRDIDFIGYRFSYGKTTLRKTILHRAKAANDRLYSGKFTLNKLRTANAYNGWIKTSDVKKYVADNLHGDIKLENYKLKMALNKERDQYLNSVKYEHVLKVESEINSIREQTEFGDHVLVRYYPSSDNTKVVVRCKFKFPDEDEYYNRKEMEKQEMLNKKKKKTRQNKSADKLYYPSAEIYFSEDKNRCIMDYNTNINCMNVI